VDKSISNPTAILLATKHPIFGENSTELDAVLSEPSCFVEENPKEPPTNQLDLEVCAILVKLAKAIAEINKTFFIIYFLI
jgi:hypothetical protein